jgi:hypothetical protein
MTKHRKERQRREEPRHAPQGDVPSDRRQKPVEEPRPAGEPPRHEEPKPIEGESEDTEL